jgi:hypothetical protein
MNIRLREFRVVSHNNEQGSEVRGRQHRDVSSAKGP